MLELAALLALIMSTASLAVQVTLWITAKKQAESQPQFAFTDFDTETLSRAAPSKKPLAPFEKDPTNHMLDAKFNEAFASNDSGFTGIDDSFDGVSL
jgi:hypothetical protein